ncbi:MAG: TIR domain-containing protein [Syntrophaceae bacterium]|nr:TIR domain-containing protein [Syntrophaceae bacterium]
MPKRQVFYSFHYKNDVWRVHQIRNIGAIEDNKPVSNNEWEEIKRNGDSAIKRYIDDNMSYRSCVIVLVGEETAKRKWVRHEIKKAWNDEKGLLGIYIHNLKDKYGKKCSQGLNPFDEFTLKDGSELSSVVKCYDPNSADTYNHIKDNIEKWIEDAIEARN